MRQSMGIVVVFVVLSHARAEENSEQSTADVLEGHSFHGEVFNDGPRQSAYLMGGTGKIDFPVESDNELVQNFINQGVGQLHGFWYFEAERTFRQVAAIDRDCAAAYWGMAMANANNKSRAKDFIKEAVNRREHASERVRMYIDALDKRLNSKKKKSDAARQYIKDLEQIVYKFPDDLDAKAFIALELWNGRRNDMKVASYVAVNALIESVLAVEPYHPVHHYRIHLWDYERPENALSSAARCGQSAPSIAHMWHMPGHIYSRLKRYDDAVWQQEASARTDHAQMMRDQLLPDQIHNFAHNNEWLIRNLMFIGRISDALDLAKNMIELPRHPKYNSVKKGGSSAAYGRQRLFQVLSQGELWRELLALADSPYLEPTDDHAEQVKRLRHIGRAAYALRDLDRIEQTRREIALMLCDAEVERTDAIEKARRKTAEMQAQDSKELSDKVDKAIKKATSDDDRDISRLTKAMDEMNAHQELANGNVAKALALFKKAGSMHRLFMFQVEFLAGDKEETLGALEKYTDDHQGETLPLAHLVDLAFQAGRTDIAERAFRKLQAISSDVDTSAPPFTRVSAIASNFDPETDWRIAKIEKADVGDRPELDSLGPFRWSPSEANNWTLPNNNGSHISLQDFRGKPVIVIFYLGFGCLHCAEQLQGFAPRVDEFAAAGIDMVAISTDNLTKLKESVDGFGGSFPIELVSDSNLEVFKQYRVYDGFENQPLHGTFLIDGSGRILWHDIGYEPFMDHEFLLKEAPRLIKSFGSPVAISIR